MGFKACIVPKSVLQSLDKNENYGINIIGVSNLKQAFKALEVYEEKKRKAENKD